MVTCKAHNLETEHACVGSIPTPVTNKYITVAVKKLTSIFVGSIPTISTIYLEIWRNGTRDSLRKNFNHLTVFFKVLCYFFFEK